VTLLDKDLADRIERLLQEAPPKATEPVDFWAARFDAGLAWVHYPQVCGGLGADPEQQALVEARLAEAGAPSNFPLNPMGLGMVGPTIVHHGTEEQKARFLRRLYSCADIWCQLFSEPGAGSDLAGLATRAVRDGDEWVVNGQKVWTSKGDIASFGLLLARTDVDAPKNKGLTTFLIDMRSPGVEVRPLKQMTGDAEFSEVYFEDVRLPADAQLGPEGKGWLVATTTLMNERTSIGNAMASFGSDRITQLLALFRERGGGPVLRDRVVQVWMGGELSRIMSMRASQLGQSGDPGPVGSVGKLFGAEHALRVNELTIDLLGADGMRGDLPQHRQFLRSRANTIEGGTSEVMRNILAERMLGLPRDDHGPKDRPWREIPRS
jgi:alkylation response protein AidB-like acyl-CoA dehydrogenase